jgi:hypothetical protein
MLETLLEFGGLILLFVICEWLGIPVDIGEFAVVSIFACVLLVIVVRSAYCDACRRQRWPGKNREKVDN